MFIKRIWLRLSVATFFCLLPLHASSQIEDKIGAEISSLIASHPYRVGIFRVQPTFVVATSYDSNIFYGAQVEVSDYFTAISPGASFALKLGRRAYFLLKEDVNIVIYQERDQLNGIFNTTSGTFGIGSRRLLLEFNGSYLKRKSLRYDPESDQPTQQRSASAGMDLSLALRRRTDLHFNMRSNDLNFDFVNNVVTDLPLPPDTRTVEFGAAVDQEVIPEIAVTFEGYRGYTDFTDLADPLITDSRANYWRVLTGFDFRGKRISGRTKAGLESREEIRTEQGRFRSLIIDTSVDYALAKRLAIGGFLNRTRRASALLQNDFRLLLQGGVRASVPISRALFMDGTIRAGKNDYGGERIFTDQLITQDDFRRYDAGMNIVLPKNLVVRVGISYTDRRSNVDFLNKDRFTFNVGIALEPRGSGTQTDQGYTPGQSE